MKMFQEDEVFKILGGGFEEEEDWWVVQMPQRVWKGDILVADGTLEMRKTCYLTKAWIGT